MLNEKIAKEGPWSIVPGTRVTEQGQDRMLVDVVEEGIRDGIMRLNTQSANGRLLYGFHPEETLVSIIYQSIERARDGKPIMPDPYCVLPIEELAKIQEDYLGAARAQTSGEIRFLIRQGLMKLFQLARPEQVFLVESFPQSYLQEYMLAQEHFNMVIFQRSLLASLQSALNAWDGSSALNTPFARKWCVYTRSSADVTSIAVKADLQEQVANLLSIPRASFTVMALAQFMSRSACEDALNAFITMAKNSDPKKPLLLLCIADRDSVNNEQINFFRGRVDEKGRLPPNVLVVTLLHFPPERAFGASNPYPAIFVNGWDFAYADAFGLAARDSSALESGERSVTRGFLGHQGEIDGRGWIAWAFNLTESDNSASPILAAFEQVFDQLLVELRVGVVFSLLPLMRYPKGLDKGTFWRFLDLVL